VALLVSVAVVGCTQPGEINQGFTKNHSLGSATAYVGVEPLADELGMTMVSTSISCVTLRSEATSNFVVIFSEPNGRVFVNGDAVCASGAIVRDGEWLIPASVQEEIRDHLRAEFVSPAPRPVAARTRDSQSTPSPTSALVKVEMPKPVRGLVMIDPGHGGKDPGAKSVLGYWEAPITLAVGLKVRELLADSGVTVEMTRDGAEMSLDKYGRAALSCKKKPDVFVSIHADAAARTEADGYTVYVARNEKGRGLAVALAIERCLHRAGFARHSADPVAYADFVVLKDNTQPAVLVELGYLTNPADAARLRDGAHQAKYAAAICEGILEYLRRANGD